MASFSLTTQQLIQREYGIEGIRVTSANVEQTAVSNAGTPVYEIMQVQKESYSYFDVQQTRKRDDGLIPEYTFPHEVLMEVSQAKKIIKTEVAGMPGSIKEYNGLSDYSITIRGFIINYETEEYPEADVRALKRVLDIPHSLKVSSLYLNRLGIDRIVVTEYSMPNLEGHVNVQPFVINASSDFPIELELIKRKLQ